MKTIILFLLCASIASAQPKGKIGITKAEFLKDYAGYELTENSDTLCLIERYKHWDVKGTLQVRFRNDSLLTWAWVMPSTAHNLKGVYNSMVKKFGKSHKLYENSEGQAWWFLKNGEAYCFEIGELGDDSDIMLTHLKIDKK